MSYLIGSTFFKVFFFHQPGGVRLTELRWNIGNALCGDQIYGVLSLLDQRYADLGTLPDYTKTVPQVYEDVVVRYLRCFADLNILSQCRFKANLPGPSWIPDWSVRNERPLILTNTYASGPFVGRCDTSKAGHLKVAGVSVGPIRKLQRLDLHQRSRPEDFVMAIRQILSSKTLLGDYVGGGNILEAYVRTLCLDDFAENYEPLMEGTPRLDITTQVMLQLVSGSQTSVPQHTDSWRDFLRYAGDKPRRKVHI
jgi:hypothetical protein